MKIVELSQREYKDYADNHPNKNIGQSIEFAALNINNNKRKIFLGFVDNTSKIHAATLIFIKNINSKIKGAISPNGFLIDYTNFDLLEEFTNELIKYLKSLNITYLITNPMFRQKVYNNNNKIIENNTIILENLLILGYKNIGYIDNFEKYDVIIENATSISEIFNRFNRSTKRNIKDGFDYDINLNKIDFKELYSIYDIIKLKKDSGLEYYQSLFNKFNNDTNKAEIYVAKLDTLKYLANCKREYEEEKIYNDKINDKFNKLGLMNKKRERLFNIKINSNKRLESKLESLNRATLLNQEYNGELIIGISIIIKNKKEIYFLMDAYNNKCKFIHATHILKWAIIKKYFNKGYRTFNIGEIHQNYLDKTNKYHNQYLYKKGFGGNIIEYPPNLMLIINKNSYNLYQKNKKTKKK